MLRPAQQCCSAISHHTTPIAPDQSAWMESKLASCIGDIHYARVHPGSLMHTTSSAARPAVALGCRHKTCCSGLHSYAAQTGKSAQYTEQTKVRITPTLDGTAIQQSMELQHAHHACVITLQVARTNHVLYTHQLEKAIKPRRTT